jgi:MFS family permease
MDILLESFSKNATMGRTRSIYYTFINLGWIGAPLLSAWLIKTSNYSAAFLVAAFLVLPIFLIILSQKKRLNDHIVYSREKISTAVRRTWHNKNLRGVFFIALLLSMFFSSVVLYMPLYLHENLGMAWNVLGPIFSFMLLPFILVEIPAGILADKYWGEKEMLTVGFAVLIVSLLLFYFIDQPIVWLWALVLFLSRLGAALIEAMREAYFFKIVDPGDVGYINIFRTTIPLGYVLGSGLALLILTFSSLPCLFLALAIIMLSSFFFIHSIKDTK